MDHPGMSMDPDASLIGSFANMRLRYLLDSGDWTGEIAGWTLPKSAGAGARLDFAFARALGEIMQGHRDEARLALAELESVGHEVADIKAKSGDPDPSYRVRPEIFLLEGRALLAEQDKDFAAAERLLLQAVDLEDKLPIAFGPPTIDKPSHELLGEFLMRRGRRDEAHAEFDKAIARTPGRRLTEQGLVATVAGKSSRPLP
jgi:tetratricopeptide (TPR) repeat protein